jgi:hypothetical protein
VKFRFKFPRPAGGKLETEGLIDGMFSAIALWQLVFLIGVTVAVSMWNLDAVRVFLFEQIEHSRAERAVQALSDPSDEVAAAACYYMLTDGDGSMYAHLANTLYRRPQVALRCLEKTTAQVERLREQAEAERKELNQDRKEVWPRMALPTGPQSLVPGYVLIASTLGQRWMSDLIDGSDNTCRTAYNTRRALELARVDPTYRLMSCAIGADAPGVRECCVTQLGGHEAFLELLDRPNLVPLYPASFDFRALVGSAFPSVPLASDLLGRRYQRWWAEIPVAEPATAANGGGERFGDLQFDVQDWVVDVGCRIHYNLRSRRLVPAAFVPLVESEGCAPSTPPWSGMYSPTSWSDMCLGMYKHRRKMAFTPRDSICGSLATSTVGRTIVTARLIVAGALNDGQRVPGVRREKIELVGDNFGERLFGFAHGPPVNEDEEADVLWRADGFSSPMGAW